MSKAEFPVGQEWQEFPRDMFSHDGVQQASNSAQGEHVSFDKTTAEADDTSYQGELISRDQPGFAPQPRTRTSTTGRVASLAGKMTPAGAAAEGIRAAAGPLAEGYAAGKKAKAIDSFAMATNPEAAAVIAKDRRSSRRMKLLAAVLAATVASGTAYEIYDILKGPERLVNKGLDTPGKVLDKFGNLIKKGTAPDATANIRTTLEKLRLNGDIPLVDGEGTVDDDIYQHGGFSGNWHKASTHLDQGLRSWLRDPKDSLRFSVVENSDGSPTLVAMMNPNNVELETYGNPPVTESHNGPLAGSESKYGEVTQSLAVSTFISNCGKVVLQKAPEGLAHKLKEDETMVTSLINLVDAQPAAKQEVVDAYHKMLSRPIMVRWLIPSSHGDQSALPSEVDIKSMAVDKAIDVQKQIADRAKMPFAQDQSGISTAIGFSKENSDRLKVNLSKTCDISPEVLKNVEDIDAQSGITSDSKLDYVAPQPAAVDPSAAPSVTDPAIKPTASTSPQSELVSQ